MGQCPHSLRRIAELFWTMLQREKVPMFCCFVCLFVCLFVVDVYRNLLKTGPPSKISPLPFLNEVVVYRNLLKTGPPSKISPLPFLNEVVAKGAFSLSGQYTHLLMPQHMQLCLARSSSTVQEEELTNEARYYLLLLHKQTYGKRGIAESLHVYKTRARLTACEVGVFLRYITTLENTSHPPL